VKVGTRSFDLPPILERLGINSNASEAFDFFPFQKTCQRAMVLRSAPNRWLSSTMVLAGRKWSTAFLWTIPIVQQLEIGMSHRAEYGQRRIMLGVVLGNVLMGKSHFRPALAQRVKRVNSVGKHHDGPGACA